MSARPRTIFSGTSGLHNRVDPFRVIVDYRSNIRAFPECNNVMADDTGRADRVPGLRKIYGLSAHSLFSCGDYALFVANNYLNVISGTTLQTEPVWPLSYGALPMSFARVDSGGSRHVVYFSNGVDMGIYSDGAVLPWEVTPYTGSDRTTRIFSGPPKGHLIHVWDGRMLVSGDNIIWYSEPYSYGCFDLAYNRLHFAERVRLMAGVSGGLWVGDTQGLYYLDGHISPATGELPRKVAVTDYPPLEGHAARVSLDEFPDLGQHGQGWIVVTAKGICLLGPGGFFNNLTGRTLEFRGENNAPLDAERGQAFSDSGRSFFTIYARGDEVPVVVEPVSSELDLAMVDYVDRQAAENIGGHRIVTTDDDGLLIYADRTIEAHGTAVLGMTSGAVTAGMEGRVVTEGPITDSALSLVPGKPVFLGTEGQYTQTPPESGFSLIVGFAIKSDTIRVRVEQPVFMA